MSVLTLPAVEGPHPDRFTTIYDDLLATLRLHTKHSDGDGDAKHIAAVLFEHFTTEKEDLRAKCVASSGPSRPAQAQAST